MLGREPAGVKPRAYGLALFKFILARQAFLVTAASNRFTTTPLRQASNRSAPSIRMECT